MATHVNVTQPINPYIAGDPVGKTCCFIGREDILREVERVIHHPSQNAITLYGQRRIGKTSILQYLASHLPETGDYRTVFIDLMHKSELPIDELVRDLARTIASELEIADPMLSDPSQETFRTHFLPKVLATLSSTARLILLLDEFDALADPQADRQLKQSFFSYLRDLRQFDPQRLKFIFVLGRNINDLDVVAHGLFKDLPSQRISLLSEQETARLIRLSERDRSLNWSNAAVQTIWRFTSGHPYLTQALCYEVWEQAYQRAESPRPVDPVDVERAVEKALERSRHALEWLWNGLGPAEKVALAALASAGQAIITEEQLAHILTESGVRIMIRELNDAPRRLCEWDILREVDGGYQIRVELLRRWVAENKPLSRTWDEIDRLSPLADNLYNVARGRYDNGEFERALANVDEALSVNPNHLGAQVLRAEILIATGKNAEARATLEQLHAIAPAKARHRLKQVYLKLVEIETDLDRQRVLLDGAYERLPTDCDIQAARRAVYARIGAIKEAQGELEAALTAYGEADDRESYERINTRLREQMLHQLLHKLADLKRQRDYAKARQLVAEWRTIYQTEYNWQSELEWLERTEQCDHIYQQAVSSLIQGERDAAKRLLAEVIAINPDYEQASRYLYLAITGVDPQELQATLESYRQTINQLQTNLHQYEQMINRLQDYASQCEQAVARLQNRVSPSNTFCQSSHWHLAEVRDERSRLMNCRTSPRQLSRWNPIDTLRLLWWISVNPANIQAYQAVYGAESLHPLGNRLTYTLIFIPLLILGSGHSLGLLGERFPIAVFATVGIVLLCFFYWLLANICEPVVRITTHILVFGLTLCMASIVTFGIGSSIIFSVILGVVIGIALGVALGVATRITQDGGAEVLSGTILGVWLGGGNLVFGGLAFGVAILKAFLIHHYVKKARAIPWLGWMLALSWSILTFYSFGGLVWIASGVWPAPSWPDLMVLWQELLSTVHPQPLSYWSGCRWLFC